MKRIFVSSVQKEFADIRGLLKRYIAKNPAYRRLFDTFVFEEDTVAADRRTDEVYLEELGQCDIYLGLIGDEYGHEDPDGMSPTEREFDEATRLVNVPVNVPVKSSLQERVLEAVVSTPGVNRIALAKMLDVDVRTVGRVISALKGRVEFRGAPKNGGYWEVVRQ